MDSQHETYILGRDGHESKRLDEQHEFLKAVFRNALIDPSIPLNNTLSIADVGTGTGVWLRDVSETLQHSCPAKEPRLFHGFDISDAQFPAAWDDGFKFTVHDVLQPFPPAEHGRYDLVHVRLLIAALKEEQYARAASNLLALLKPGGYLQWVEADNSSFAVAPPPSEPPVVKEIRRILTEAMTRSGASLQTARSVYDGVTSAGLQDVRANYHKPAPELRGRVVQWSERMLHAILPHALVRLGEVDSMAAATQRTGEMLDIYMRECPEWGTAMAQYVCIVGRKAY